MTVIAASRILKQAAKSRRGPVTKWFNASVALVLLILPRFALADIFVLKDGGRIEGELLNPDQTEQAGYKIRQLDGGTVTLAVDDVTKIIPWSKEKAHYIRILPDMPATADGNWIMAEWCLGKRLMEEREAHLEEVIRLDPNHAKARKALGYTQANGAWVLPEEIMQQRGFVRYEGRWRLPIDVERMEAAKKQKADIAEWKSKVRLWRKWLGGRRNLEAIDNLESINDPLAVPAITELLQNDDTAALHRLAIKLLARIGNSDTIIVLSRFVMETGDDDLRDAALEQLVRYPSPNLTNFFAQQLRSKENFRIQRAAYALGWLNDPEAIKPLIDSLVTQHSTVEAPANPNQISAGFGGGAGTSGTGFSTGSRPKVVKQLVENRAVLDALTKITGVNFQYDQAAWRDWLIRENHKDLPVNLRRGE